MVNKHDLSVVDMLFFSVATLRKRIKISNPARPNVTPAPRQGEDKRPTPTDTMTGSTVSQGLTLTSEIKAVEYTDLLLFCRIQKLPQIHKKKKFT